MATLAGRTPAQTYPNLGQVEGGIDGTLKRLEDGEGTASSVSISTNKFQIRPASNGTDSFEVVNSSGSVIFQIDTTNNKIVLPSGVTIEGDGSGLTGVLSAGVGGASSTGDLVMQADSDSSGSGDAIFKIGTKVVARIPYSYFSSLPIGVEGNYFVKTVADNWGQPFGGAKLVSGSSQRYTVPDNDNLDMGTNDFSFFNWFNLADFTPSAEVVLAQKVASNLGWRLSLTTSGQLKLSIGNGTDMTTYVYTGTAIGATDGTWNLLGFTADRDGNVTFYKNNIAYGTADISGGSAQTVSNTGDLYWAYNGTTYYTMDINTAYYFNMIASSDARKAMYNNGRPDLASLPYADLGASNTNLASALTWSTVTDLYETFTSSGNEITSAINTTGNARAITSNGINVKIGEKYRISFTLTLNSGQAPSGIRLRDGAGGNDYSSLPGFTAVNGFNSAELDITATGACGLFLFNDAPSDFELSNLVITKIGCVAEWKNFGRLGAIETQNGLHASSSGSPIALEAEQRVLKYRDVKLSIANTATALTNIVPKGYRIASIRAKASASLTGVKIGTSSGGEQVVASTTAGTTASLLTLASTANAGYSETASVTLYAEHATSGQTLNLIFEFEKVGN